MKAIIASFLLLVFILPQRLMAQANQTTLKILSWNIYMLPRHIKHTGKVPRAKQIGQILKNSDYDVIVFQEAFHGGARRKIRKAFGENFPYRVGPANLNPWWFKTSSGVWIVSKFPLKQLGTVDFKDCEGPDCWARKGAVLVEGEKDGKPFQILGTHLEAGGPQTIRDNQYKEISGLLNQYVKDGVPQFVCGDFNTHHEDTANYNRMLVTLAATDSLPAFTNGLNYINGINKKDRTRSVIDYVLCRNNKCTIASIQREMKIIRAPWKKEFDELSDHFAIEAIIKF